MNSVARSLSVALVLTGTASVARAQVLEFTDETAFLNALAGQGYVVVHEGFEDDSVWGAARSPLTVPSITNLGIAWTSSSPNNDLSSSSGAARSGLWGIYSLPHGDYANGITDGWRGTASQPLVAIGGWVRTNTPPAGLVMFLDGDEQNPIDFGGANALGGPHQFFGVINPTGFSVFDFRETEGTIGDQKFIFGDDFSFAFGGVIVDCNQNSVADGIDIATGTSQDCNHNFIPDECEIDVNSPAPGGPFFCVENCAPDCNNNGLLDECEVVTTEVYASGPLSPIGQGSPQSFTIMSPPMTRADAILDFTAYANLGGAPDEIAVNVNGVSVGSVFGLDGSDCPEQQPDAAQLVVPMDTFNNAVGGGDAVINMVASAEVDPQGCNLPTYIAVEVQLSVPSANDMNENGIPDVCEDCRGSFDGDGDVDTVDFGIFTQCFGGSGNPPAASCPPGTNADFDNDNDVDSVDFSMFAQCFGGSNNPPAAGCPLACP